MGYEVILAREACGGRPIWRLCGVNVQQGALGLIDDTIASYNCGCGLMGRISSASLLGLRTSQELFDGSVWHQKYLSKVASCHGLSCECLHPMPSVIVDRKFFTFWQALVCDWCMLFSFIFIFRREICCVLGADEVGHTF